MKSSFFATVLFLLSAILPFHVQAQPSWTDFTYTDWSPGSQPAISNLPGYQAYDSATVWDGDRFVTFFQGTDAAPYLIAASSDGQTWNYLNGESPVSITGLFGYGVGHHTVAAEPDGFPAADTAWPAQDGNVRFKLWYANTGASPGEHIQYAESTNGIDWQAFTEGIYCPPTAKTDTYRILSHPSVLYRPDGLSDLSTDDPMDNRYLMYLNSGEDGDPYYYELYLSSNGLDWTLFAWDSYCETRFAAQTVFETVTFSDYTGEPDYPNTFEEVYYNSTRQGWMLWTSGGSTGPIASWYSTDGYNWVFREEPINGIGQMNGQTGYWNEDANCNLDSVRLGTSYFFLRSGLTGSPVEKHQLGAGVIKGKMSADVDDLPSRIWGNTLVTYRLFSWNNQTCPQIEAYIYLGQIHLGDAAQGSGGDGKINLSTGIGGAERTFAWNSSADFHLGQNNVFFRIIPVISTSPYEEGEYDTIGPINVNLPSPTPTPEGYKTPTPTPSPTLTPKPTSTPSPTPGGFKTPTPAPTGIPSTPTPKPTPSITPTPEGYKTPIPTPSFKPTLTPTPTAPPHTPTPKPTPSTKPTYTPSPTVTATPTPSPTSAVPPWIYDYDGDGTSDIGIYRKNSGLWAIRGVTRVYFGTSVDSPVPGDYNADRITDIGIFRPSSGLWAIRKISRIYFGTSGDRAVQGDYDGSGTWAVGIFRPSSSLWAIRGVTRIYFGGSSDIPVPGYYRGDLSREIGIFRPAASALWAIRGLTRVYFGGSSDTAVPGDYDGDGTWEAGIFRPASSLWAVRAVTRTYFGISTDTPVPGDYDGDGDDAIGIFRPASSALWAIKGETRVYFGASADTPVSR